MDGLLVVEIDGKYAGFVYWFQGVVSKDDSNIENFAFIYEMDIVKDFWGKNVGLYLEKEAHKQIEGKHLSALYANVNESNKPLRRLYEQVGFTTYGRTLHMRFLYPQNVHGIEVPHDEAVELGVYMTELKKQCRILSVTYQEVEELINEGPPRSIEEKRRFHAKIWSRIQSVLSATSAITHIIWPQPLPKEDGSDKKAIHRGQELRRFLGIQGMRSFFPTDVRNAFEHIDEKIAEWLPTQPETNPWGWSLSPFEKGKDPPQVGSAIRYFNINTKELRVAGASCNLRKVVYLAKEIEKRLPQEAQFTYGTIENWDLDKND